MSCPEDSESSDYGSDFSPDEEQLLNDLLNKAAGHATGQAATSQSTPILISTPTLVEQPTPPQSPELADLASSQPAALATLVADIEDVVEQPNARRPKVLGREARAPWWTRPRPDQRLGREFSATGRSSPYAGNSSRSHSSGMLVLHFDYDFAPLHLSFDPGLELN